MSQKIIDYKYLKQLSINEKWNSVMITTNSDEHAQLFNLLDSYMALSKKVLIPFNNKTEFPKIKLWNTELD